MVPPPPPPSKSTPSTYHDNNNINMASSDSQTPQKPTAAKFAYLMTPEEQMSTSFAHDRQEESVAKLAPIHGLASPPTSPATQTLPNIIAVTGYPPSPQYSQQNNYATGYGSAGSSAHPTPAFGDAALFPPEVEHAQPQSPLFDQHDRQPSTSPRYLLDRTTPETVGFSLNFPFSLDIRTPKEAWDYWKSCCADAGRLGRIQLPVPLGLPSSRDPISVRQLQSIERTHLPRTRTTVPRTTTHRVVKPSTLPERKPSGTIHVSHRRTPRQKPRLPSVSEPIRVSHHRASPKPTPEHEKAAKHRRAPASKPRPIGEDWSDIPDFCPPISSLTTASRPLKARPVGSSGALDLSSDPDRAQLHPDELAVASTLRLQCAKYLLNKRKIFKAKVEHLRAAKEAAAAGNMSASGTNFNKTEAQKACTIDVNKASSLYQAFEDVGWFRREWFEQYL